MSARRIPIHLTNACGWEVDKHSWTDVESLPQINVPRKGQGCTALCAEAHTPPYRRSASSCGKPALRISEATASMSYDTRRTSNECLVRSRTPQAARAF